MNKYWRPVGGFVLSFILVGILLPSRPQVLRDIVIDAHPATVFVLLNDLRRVNLWSPKTEDDPNARVVFSGPPLGIDATLQWNGQIIGKGRQVITESMPFERVANLITLNEDTEISSVFTLAPHDGMTKVVWTCERDFGWSLAGRYFGLLLNRIHGPRLEKDLGRLADLAESLPQADFSDLEVEQIVVEAADIAYLTTTSRPDAAAMSEAMGESFFDILSFIDRHGLSEAGAPLSITRTFSGSQLVFDAAIPVRNITTDTPRLAEAVKIGTTYGGPVIRVEHVGSYAGLGGTHDKIAAFLAARGIKRNGDAWESYISDPSRSDESGLITYVYYPVVNQD